MIVFGLLVLSALRVSGQVSLIREKTINILASSSDTINLDTLSIIKETFFIKQNNLQLDSTQYTLLAAEGNLILKKTVPRGNITVRYAVYPYLFTQIHSHKNQETFTTSPKQALNPFLYRPQNRKMEDPFGTGGLTKSGSLSRGISFGNSRDVSVNSSLNLQLAGKLSDNLDLLMVATDDNLPIQADGTTQQLQEFDRVFIQLTSKSSKLIGGDFFTVRPNSYFMNFNKRGQGLNVTAAIPMVRLPKDKLIVGGSIAISKGKFSRNVIQGVEGNQGPYRLRGAENELFIVILSGTEKIYIDGKLLLRGQENDYIINYNTGELIFTAKQLITKDIRIVVEFQYSDKNYSRSLAHGSVEYKKEKSVLRFNAYSEQDSKNQPLQQALTNDDKLTMAEVGDTLLNAIIAGVDSVAFSGDLVLYKKIDTLVNAVIYQDVYVYWTTADSAHFRCRFSYVGSNKGNYIQFSSAANEKTFKWVAPIGNVPQGDYEPVILLTTPKKKQLVTLGGDLNFIKNTVIKAEVALSNNDLNTFSPYDHLDNQGYGAQFSIKNKQKIKDSLIMAIEGNYEFISHYFSPLERYRPVEFERDWNLGSQGQDVLFPQQQHIGKAAINFNKSGFGNIGYGFSAFLQGLDYSGIKHSMNTAIRKKGFSIIAKGSLLNSTGLYGKTNFIRQRVDVSQKIYKQVSISAYEDQEINTINKPNSDTLKSISRGYLEWQGAINVADSSKKSFTIFYKQRTDQLPNINFLTRATFAENIGGVFTAHNNPNHLLRLTTSYRKLSITSPLLTVEKPDNTLIGRLEYSMRMWKGIITGSTFYEVGSGLEVKKEYTYIEVTSGQGSYVWTDYNNDEVKQLNEFEIAVYSDQANYIRVYTPTNDYVKVYTNQFSQSLNIRPSVKWGNTKGVRGFIGKFSNQASYRVERKTQDKNFIAPVLTSLNDMSDTALVALNATARNTIAFNQLSSKYGFEYTWQETIGKSLLTNGLDARGNTFQEGKVRWNITSTLSIQGFYRDGYKNSYSEYFQSKNYRIHYYDAEPKLNIQPAATTRVSFSYRYSKKQNTPDLGGEQATVQKVGAELKLSKLSKGSLVAEGNWVNIHYTGVESSSIGYDMLEGLKQGENFTWKLSWQKSFAQNLQLTIGYEGRKSPGNKFIHVGSAQVRAIF